MVEEQLNAGDPELIPVNIEKICHVSGAETKNILGWFTEEIDRHRRSPVKLGGIHIYNFMYWVYPLKVSLQDFRTLALNGTIRIYETDDNKQLKLVTDYTGEGIYILIDCLKIIDAPISKMQVTMKCRGIDVLHSASSFMEALFEKFINVFDAQPYPLPQVKEQSEAQEWIPWLHIPDEKEGRKIIQLWCEGKNAKEIAQEVFMKAETIHNIISKLRIDYPEARIPKDRERKSMRL